MKKALSLVHVLAVFLALVVTACDDSGAKPASSDSIGNTTTDKLMDIGDSTRAPGEQEDKDFGNYTSENPLKLKLATMQAAERSHLNTLAVAFKERVEIWSEGAVIVDVYMGSMGSDREIVDQVIAGTVDMGVNNTAIMANYNRMFDVLDIGYLIRDYDDVYDVMASDIWSEMLAEFSDTGASLLALQCIGFRTLCTTEKAGPVKNKAELANKTIRITEGEVFIDDYKAWGAAPVSLSAAEILPALQNGTIDGVDHVPVTLYTRSGQYEYISYVSLFNQAAHFNGLTINNKVLEGLPSGIRKIIEDAAYEAAEFRTKALEKDNDTYIQKLKDEWDITFYTPTREEIDEMIDAVEPVYDNFVASHKFGSYAEAIRKICADN